MSKDERNTYIDAAKRAGDRIEQAYGTAEGKADELVGKGETGLAKLKKSRWTAAALAGATVVGTIAAYLIIK